MQMCGDSWWMIFFFSQPSRKPGKSKVSPAFFFFLSSSITNLKYWGRCEPITSKTLQLLNDLSIGYPFLSQLLCTAGTVACHGLRNHGLLLFSLSFSFICAQVSSILLGAKGSTHTESRDNCRLQIWAIPQTISTDLSLVISKIQKCPADLSDQYILCSQYFYILSDTESILIVCQPFGRSSLIPSSARKVVAILPLDLTWTKSAIKFELLWDSLPQPGVCRRLNPIKMSDFFSVIPKIVHS